MKYLYLSGLIIYTYIVIASTLQVGVYLGQISIGDVAGPALYRCVELLGGRLEHKKNL